MRDGDRNPAEGGELDYLEWAAAGFRRLVRYGHEVVDIRGSADHHADRRYAFTGE